MEEAEARHGPEAMGLMQRPEAAATAVGLALGEGDSAADGERLEPGHSCKTRCWTVMSAPRPGAACTVGCAKHRAPDPPPPPRGHSEAWPSGRVCWRGLS